MTFTLRKKYAETDDQEQVDTGNYAHNEEVKQQSQLPGILEGLIAVCFTFTLSTAQGSDQEWTRRSHS